MNNKLKKIKKEGLLKFKEGQASGVRDFFEQLIKPQFENNEDAIKIIHKALMRYVMNEKIVFPVRLYGSVNNKKKDYDKLRRGFLSIYPDGMRMVFCDNTFAMPFAALKLHGESFTCDDLVKYLNQPNVLCGFKSTQEEREIAYYSCNNEYRINLNSAGWYLAHIIPVGKEYLNGSIRKIIPNPDRTEWEVSDDKIRYVSENLSNEVIDALRAHFLRFVHPLNSFVVPNRNLIKYDGANIGEEKELIDIVRDYIQNRFPEEYNELSKFIQIPEINVSKNHTTNKIGRIVWSNSTGVKKKKTNTSKDKKTNKDNSKEFHIQRVRSRVLGWKRRKDQVNSRILGLFMELSDNGKNGVFVDMLEYEFGTKYPDEVEIFRKNYVQMKNFGANNHAKVFDEDEEKTVWLWEPVKDFIIETYSH